MREEEENFEVCQNNKMARRCLAVDHFNTCMSKCNNNTQIWGVSTTYRDYNFHSGKNILLMACEYYPLHSHRITFIVVISIVLWKVSSTIHYLISFLVLLLL